MAEDPELSILDRNGTPILLGHHRRGGRVLLSAGLRSTHKLRERGTRTLTQVALAVFYEEESVDPVPWLPEAVREGTARRPVVGISMSSFAKSLACSAVPPGTSLSEWPRRSRSTIFVFLEPNLSRKADNMWCILSRSLPLFLVTASVDHGTVPSLFARRSRTSA
jgi:hypothetical protein